MTIPFETILKVANSAINDAGLNIKALNNVRKELWMYKHTTELTQCQVNKLENLEKKIEELKIMKYAEEEFFRELRDLQNYQNNQNYNLNNLLSKVKRKNKNNINENKNKYIYELIRFLEQYRELMSKRC